jgi:hypothetical protein
MTLSTACRSHARLPSNRTHRATQVPTRLQGLQVRSRPIFMISFLHDAERAKSNAAKKNPAATDASPPNTNVSMRPTPTQTPRTPPPQQQPQSSTGPPQRPPTPSGASAAPSHTTSSTPRPTSPAASTRPSGAASCPRSAGLSLPSGTL